MTGCRHCHMPIERSWRHRNGWRHVEGLAVCTDPPSRDPVTGKLNLATPMDTDPS